MSTLRTAAAERNQIATGASGCVLRRFHRAFDLTTDRVTAYITKRQAAGAANATASTDHSQLLSLHFDSRNAPTV